MSKHNICCSYGGIPNLCNVSSQGNNHIKLTYCGETKKSAHISGHRPVIVKRAVIGSKGGWKLSTISFSCKVFHDWSIIKLREYMYLLDGYIFAVLFETSHLLLLKEFTGVA